jgi:hypothetical protein
LRVALRAEGVLGMATLVLQVAAPRMVVRPRWRKKQAAASISPPTRRL